MDNVKKVYMDIPETGLGQFLDDLNVDLRDVPHAPPKTIKQDDGKFKVEVNIAATTSSLTRYSGSSS